MFPLAPPPEQQPEDQGQYEQPAVSSSAVVLPPHLPAECFLTAAADYVLPAKVLVAMIKVESGGRNVIGQNSNGTQDLGAAQLNTASWVPYMQRRYGIPPAALVHNVCQSIRVMAYALRFEMNHRSCGGVDVWCGVGRYHSPNNLANQSVYIPKVQRALLRIEQTRRFE